MPNVTPIVSQSPAAANEKDNRSNQTRNKASAIGNDSDEAVVPTPSRATRYRTGLHGADRKKAATFTGPGLPQGDGYTGVPTDTHRAFRSGLHTVWGLEVGQSLPASLAHYQI